MKPIFQNCKIVGDNVNVADYMRQSEQRGHTEYILGRSDLCKILHNPHKWVTPDFEKCRKILGAPDDLSDSETLSFMVEKGFKIPYCSDKKTDSTDWGDLVDCLLLTPEKLEKAYAICPKSYEADANECPSCKSVTDSKSCRKCKRDRVPVKISKPWNSGAEFCSAWELEKKKENLTPVKQSEVNSAKYAVKIIRSTILPSGVTIGEIVDSSRKQVMVMGEYKDAATGLIIPVKALLDLVPQTSHAGISNGTEDDLKRMASRFGLLIPFSKCIADFKTAQSADCAIWPKKVFEFDYDAQGWMHLEMFKLATGEDRTDFFNIVQESEPPYEVSNPLPLYTSEMLEQGRSKILAALKLYCQCLKSNLWPSYGWNIPQSNRWGDFYRVEPSLWQQEQVLNLQHEYRTGGLPEIKPLNYELADAPLN